MLRGFHVPMKEHVRRALLDLAEREYRTPRMQASLLIEEALEHRSLLKADGDVVGDLPVSDSASS